MSEKKRILTNNLYGVDIDPQAVEVTKLSLLLKVLEGEDGTTAQLTFDRILPDLENNIKCGNSLIGQDFYDEQQGRLFDEDEKRRINTFDWKSSFPAVFRGKTPGFDAVIGNPPYVFTRGLLSEPERKYFSEQFKTSWEKQNTYMLFMELTMRLMNRNGKSSYIVPNSWLTIESARLLRELFVPRLEAVSDLNYQVFKNVSMEPCVFFVSKLESRGAVSAVRVSSKTEFDYAEPSNVNRNKWSHPNWRITVAPVQELESLIDKVVEKSSTIEELFDVRSGLQAYEKGRGKPPQSAEDVKNHIFDRKERVDEDSVRYLGGGDISRFHLSWSGLWMQYGEWLSQPREFGIFSRPRILIREITAKFPSCFHATYVEAAYLNNKSVLNVLIGNDSPVELKCALAIINSRFTSLYYRSRAVKSARKVFPKIVVKNLREFPYPSSISTEEKAKLVQLVERMLGLQEDLQRAESVWDVERITNSIKATDYEIDNLVYELYGLSEEEIELVESAG